ncbi:MAG: AMP phosphorylase [Candidatus Diapherotrites archaeon]|nr:AMP phosphorylase [Candidatus Diapherotrites archaeon]
MKRAYNVKCVDFTTAGIKVVVMNKEDAIDLDVGAMDRIEIVKDEKVITAVIDLTDTFVPRGTLGLFREAYTRLGAKDGDTVYVKPKEKPSSVKYIKQKMNGVRLTKEQIYEIIGDLMKEELSDVELTAFITAVYIRGLNDSETIALTNAVVDSGGKLHLNAKQIFDKHCIGGVAGNRTTMLVVPIVAAAGLTIPKTSSRAITSPAGTADVMEVLAPVSLSKDDIEEVVNKTGGCIVWGGAVNLAAADDKLIRIRHPLALDPRGMLLASILAKKKAVGATHVIIDIPIGEGAKIKTRSDAKELAKQFNGLGKALDMEVHSLLTDGDHPIGMAIGPSIEAIEILKILGGKDVSPELKEKSALLAGILLELGKVVPEGKGRDAAIKLIDSGKANKKFREIIEMQGGDPEVKPDDIEIGKISYTVRAEQSGRIEHIDNRGISAVVRGAGAPNDKRAGLYLHVEDGDKVKTGQELFTIYANSERKIDQALDVYKERRPIRFSKIILESLD